MTSIYPSPNFEKKKFLVVLIMRNDSPTQKTNKRMMAKTILGRVKGGGQRKAKRRTTQRA